MCPPEWHWYGIVFSCSKSKTKIKTQKRRRWITWHHISKVNNLLEIFPFCEFLCHVYWKTLVIFFILRILLFIYLFVIRPKFMLVVHVHSNSVHCTTFANRQSQSERMVFMKRLWIPELSPENHGLDHGKMGKVTFQRQLLVFYLVFIQFNLVA